MITLDHNGYAACAEAVDQLAEVAFEKGDIRSAVRELLRDSQGEFVQWNACRVLLHEVQSYGSECEVLPPRTFDPTGIEREFFALVAEWKEESVFLSSASSAAMLPSYQRIVGLGKAAVPLLLLELTVRPDHYFWALKAITGVDPVAASDRGCVPEMTRAWIEWGQKEGHL
ncbi:MAG: hypothetical protein NT171_09235 [Planctomycetota bacterium]|nr:hypothetical protein [Planctomycetota bacterium]